MDPSPCRYDNTKIMRTSFMEAPLTLSGQSLFYLCTLGEMTRLESHQVENEIFEFLKNFFSMA